MEARARHRDMLTQSGAVSLGQAWQPVGPARVSTTAFGDVTGRVSSIAADPSDPTGNTVYLGTTGGGVWKSTNAAGPTDAVTFAPLSDDVPAFSSGSLSSLSIGAVSVQPGGTGVVLAGTGDPNDALDSYYGSGLLRSADGGVTWSLIPASHDSSVTSGPDFYFIGEAFAGFAWSTVNPNMVVAAVSQSAEGTIVNAPYYLSVGLSPVSSEGLYYSTDAGQTWYMATITDGPHQVLQSSSVPFGGDGNAVTSVVWNPVRKKFYAAVRFNGYYESADGITFTRLANQPGPGLSLTQCPAHPDGTGSVACPMFRGTLAVQPVTGDMFAWSVDVNNLDQGIWRDVCAASSGVCQSNTVQFAQQISSTALEAGPGDTTILQGDYDLSLATVAAGGDTLLFAGTQDIHRCSLAAGCVWRNATNTSTCAAAQVAPFAHAIETTFASSLSLMYFGNDSGLWRSTDNVAQQPQPCSSDDAAHFQNLNSGLGSLAEVNSFAQDPANDAVLLAGLGANGTAAASQASQQVWLQVLNGFGSNVAIDPANPQNWYAESGGGVSVFRCTHGTACNAAGFGVAPAIGATQLGQDAGAWPQPLPYLLDPLNPANAIVSTCRIWEGAADGLNWSSADLLSTMLDGDQGPACNGNAVVRSLAAAGATAAQAGTSEIIYAGMADLFEGGETVGGHLFRQTINPAAPQTSTWADVYASPVVGDIKSFNPQDFAISSIAVNPHDATGQTAYVTIQGFNTAVAPTALLYRTTDAGAHWSNISSNLTGAPANSVVVDPNDANTVYVALDTGVYVTTAVTTCGSQNCWGVYGTGLPNSPVTQLATFNSGGTSLLRAATYGRGIWQIPLVTAATPTTTATVTPAALTFSSQPQQTASTVQSVTVQNTGSVPLTVTQITASGDFSESNNCNAAISAQGACSIQVTFTPTQTGQRLGILTVYGNLSGGQLSASLTGTGIPGPAIVLEPSSIVFGPTPVGSTSAPAQNITISNTGGASIHLQTPQVTGNFQISVNTCSSSLPPNTGCTVALVFSPTASGLAPGTFSITDDVGTQTAALSGTGLSPATDTLKRQLSEFSGAGGWRLERCPAGHVDKLGRLRADADQCAGRRGFFSGKRLRRNADRTRELRNFCELCPNEDRRRKWNCHGYRCLWKAAGHRPLRYGACAGGDIGAAHVA